MNAVEAHDLFRVHSTPEGDAAALQGLTLSSATTKVQLPGESDTILKVKQGDFLVDVRVVTSGGHGSEQGCLPARPTRGITGGALR